MESATLQQEIERIIGRFITQSAENSLKLDQPEPAWEEALIGYCPGSDPIFEDFKQAVGPTHFTPEELYNLTFPGNQAHAEELTVISWILPQREATKNDNRKEKVYPSRRWIMARFHGEDFNNLLRRHLVDSLSSHGIPALAPTLSPFWNIEESDRFWITSRWSERHAAFAAGLGTFGLCDGLITVKGKAHRVGSVIARARIPATPRPYTDHHAYCLHYAKDSCRICVSRCPVNALSVDGHDKKACMAHIRETCADHVKKQYDFDGYGCGLCQTAVPCESRIPEGIDLS